MRYASRQAGTAWGMDSDASEDWRKRAACRDEDPELFFPVGDGMEARLQIHRAKLVCGRCPVKRECGTHARRAGEQHGVWGGQTPQELRGIVVAAPKTTCTRCNDRFPWDPYFPHAKYCPACDMRRSRKRGTKCKRGHPRTAENTYVNPGTNKRYCRPCKRGKDVWMTPAKAGGASRG